MKFKNGIILIIALIFVISTCFVFTGCKDVPDETDVDSSARTVDFYAINDFHGATDKISTIGGFLKSNKNSNPNTVLINSGDMFQGSLESNSNYGKLLTDCMEAIGFDSFTFGNHEFDWGLDNLKTLAKSTDIPFLGANIYNWNAETREWGEFASDIAQEYVIKTLPNGLKVGIIGVIGQNQITSISSNLVRTIGFKDVTPIVSDLSKKLRNDEKCDVVVVSVHGDSKTLNAYEFKDTVDAVFCAHSHSYELGKYGTGVPYIQGGSKGKYVSHIQLSVNANGKVKFTKQENVEYKATWDNLIAVNELVDNSNDKIKDERSAVIANLDDDLSTSAIPRLVCRAIAEYALTQDEGKDIVLAMVNTARANLKKGEITYSDLYEAIPFDNVVYIAKVKGVELLNMAQSNSIWRVSGEAIEGDKYYKIAVIDYLLFHQSSGRTYDYFATAFGSGFDPVPLQCESYDIYNYRVITRDYLLNNTIRTDDYTASNNFNAAGMLGTAVDLSK